MKVRHVLVIITSIIILVSIVLAFMMGYNAGMSKGEQDAEKIRAKRLADAMANDTTIKDTNFVKVFAAPFTNQIKPITAAGFGQVVSSSMINITSEVQGVINAGIELKKGTKFKKGQVLFNIKNQDVVLVLKARKSNYLTMLTNILPDLKLDHSENFDAWLKFYNALDVEKNLPPLPETKSFKEKNFIVSRNIYSEYYNILSDQERLKKYTIIAPFDGSVLNAMTDEGAVTGPGSPVLSVIRQGNLEIEVPIKSEEIDWVKSGAEVVLYDNNVAVAKGKVNRKGTYVNPQTQSVPVFIDIIETSVDLYNGMYLNTEIMCEGFESLIELPRKAIFNKNEVFYVENSRIIAHPVDIKLFKENTVLVKGIPDNTMIAVEPIINATDSMEVKVINVSKF